MSTTKELRKIKTNISSMEERNAVFKLWLKSFIIFLGFLVFYITSLLVKESFAINLILMTISSVFAGAVLLNIVHESVHYTYSKSKWVNRAWGLSLTILGSSILMWRERHVLSHHNYTNIINYDIDIPRTDQNLLRVSPLQPKRWYHRYQSLYSIYLYLSFPVYSLFFEEVNSFCRNKLKIKDQKLRVMILIEIIIAKCIYVFLFLYLPIVTFGWIEGLVFNYIFNWIVSAASVLPLMVGHISKDVKFIDANSHLKWFEHQVSSTVNYSLKNSLMTWYTGGNNYHIEHHLFPNMNHIHYPEISKQVKQLCRDNKLQYREYSSFWKALKNHIFRYRELGNI